MADKHYALIRWKRSDAQRHGANRTDTSWTSKWMAALHPKLRKSPWKTARMCSSPALRFFTRKIMPKQFVNCAANNCMTLASLPCLARFHRFTCYHGLGFYSRLSHHFVRLRNAHYFFDRGLALHNTSPAVLTQGLHSFGDGALLEL